MTPHPLRLEDVESVRALHKISWQALAGGFHTEAQMKAHIALMDAPEYIKAILDNNLLLLWDGPTLCGTAGWCAVAEDKDIARIRKVFIHPDRAGQGLGRYLVTAAERASGQKKFMVRSNANAESFYQRLGYRSIRRGVMLTPDADLPVVFMEKTSL